MPLYKEIVMKTLLSQLSIIGLVCFMLTACSSEPELRQLGVVDMDKIITPATYNELGYDKFREKYLGQEVTISGFSYNKRTGSTNNKSQCKLSFRTEDPELGKELTVYVYTNFFTDEMLNWYLKKHNDANPELFAYPDEVALPESVCDPECEYDAVNNSCFYRSKDLILTGKVFQTKGYDGAPGAWLYMKLKGAKY